MGEQEQGKAQQDGIDYEALAAGLDQYREGLRAMVAGLMADGFTEEQARRLVTHVMTTPSEPSS